MTGKERRMRVRPLLSYIDSDGSLRQITSADEWALRRQQLEKTVAYFLGEAPDIEPPEPAFEILEEHTYPEYRHLLIKYLVEPEEEVKAHLLVPPPERRQKGAAVLCLHGTSAAAKDTQIMDGEKPGRDFGRLFAREGFITLSPDHCCSGERQPPGFQPYDTTPFYERYPEWSMMGKAIWDGQRALDVLSVVPDVDPERLGVVGHSLGGYGSIFLSAFDERLKATISSCGLTSWEDNPKRLNWSRDHWYIHFPRLREYFLRDEVPCDMHEFAALIAPRPFLNVSGMSDLMYSPTNENMPEIGWQLWQLYDLLGAGENFANFLFGAGHDVPEYSRALMVAWMKRWLCT
ncbi:MAG: hypothetical protein GX162_05910 [Firmicutes bacterium]|jgi:hypothetical protein|nr:hypothetical protein [Bacillota bacterium]